MDQKRLFLAFALSAAILFGWNYFIERSRPPQPDNTNSAQHAANTNASPTQPSSASTPAPAPPPPTVALPTTPDNTPRRIVTIITPLYEAKLDSRGGVATSWIVKRNKDTGRELFSAGGDKNNRPKLELIPSDQHLQNVPENLRQDARSTPLRLVTGDANLDALLASRNYQIGGADSSGDEINLNPNESKSITMTLRDEASGVELVKTLTFDAETYSVALSPKLTRGGQAVPSVKLALGPSIGDQGVPHYTFYSVAPEGVAAVDGKVHLFYGKSIHETKEHPDQQGVPGTIDWAGVGDTYFAMLAIPPKRSQGLEFRTARYEHGDQKEERFLITGLLDVPADGSPTRIYVGPKDHYLLKAANKEIGQAVGREVDLEAAINYGTFGFITRPLAEPILWSIKHLYNWTGSYGVAIIIFTIIIYTLFFPLKWRSTKAMKKAQLHAPRMKELQEKMKGMKQNDPRLRELQVEQLRLMKEANPLGGCLPLLIQMPFLFALYTAITISIDFRQSPFLWIPDLSAPEPFLIRPLPVLMAASMVVLQFITPQPSADPL
ncbi:MAG: membrane protein insertase YidC, partial [Pyrinomonadaceae bacterium]|nr:membrane protein insertase YidC [Pyrinomonadaceae bacterium]